MSEIDQKLLRALRDRLASPPKKINNNALYAGSPMYFYCQLCEWQSDKLPEAYTGLPKKHCEACVVLKDAHPDVSEATLKEMAIHLPPVEIP